MVEDEINIVGTHPCIPYTKKESRKLDLKTKK
jgi:hypothetical protein